MSVQELIKKYEANIKDWQEKRSKLFKDDNYTEETILESCSILLHTVIKDLLALETEQKQSTDQALSLSDVRARNQKCEQALNDINNIMWNSCMVKDRTFDRKEGMQIMEILNNWASV